MFPDILVGLIFLAFVALWYLKPSAKDKIRKKIDVLVEEMNSKFPHDRLNFCESRSDDKNWLFAILDSEGRSVVEVEIWANDNITVCQPPNKMRTFYYCNSGLFNRIRRNLTEHHEYHVAA